MKEEKIDSLYREGCNVERIMYPLDFTYARAVVCVVIIYSL